MIEKTCHYCGISLRAPKKAGNVVVCIECTAILANKPYLSPFKSALFIANHLMRLHKRMLLTPEWTGEEMVELGDTLQSEVLTQQAKKVQIRNRIRYALAQAERWLHGKGKAA